MIYLYAADIRHLKDSKQYSELLHSLNKETQKKIISNNTPSSRIEALAAHLLLKEVFSRHNISSTDDNRYHDPTVHFCFSSSKNMMLCALSETEIGCDIKKLEAAPKKIPVQYFTLSERKYLGNFSGETLNQEFCRLWTVKESYIKMTGESFSSPAKQLEVSISEQIEILRDGNPENCHIEEYSIPGYKISVCSRDHDFAPDVKLITII